MIQSTERAAGKRSILLQNKISSFMQSSAHQKALIMSITLAQRFYLTPAITRAILRLIFQPPTEKSLPERDRASAP